MARLKINYVQMKLTEQINTLRRIVDEWNNKPLEGAQSNLFDRLSDALAEYDYEMRNGGPATERICLLCGKLVSQCYC